MRNLFLCVLLSLGMMSLGTAPASAGRSAFAPVEAEAWLRNFAPRPIKAPFAHVRFCIDHPEQCARSRVSLRKPKIRLTEARLEQLRAVTQEVNGRIKPQADAASPFGDRWTLSPRRGDCDDFAVTKRAQLLALGWPSNALLLTQVSHSVRESHLVLTVVTAAGEVVLDNLHNRVEPARRALRRIEKIQSPTDPSRWLAVTRVAPVGVPMVAAASKNATPPRIAAARMAGLRLRYL